MAIEKTIIVNVETEEAQGEVNDLNKSLEKSDDVVSEMGTSALASAKSFKVMGVSINGISKALKVLRVSLIATGIGAIVVAVGTLAAAFLDTQKGVDALNSVLIPLGEVLSTIWGIVQKLGTGLYEMVNGDVTEGFNTMAGAVENLGDQMDAAWKNGQRLNELQIQIEKNAVNDGLVISRMNRLSAEQLEIAEDINKTVEERKLAYQAAIAAEETITKIRQRENDLLVKQAERKTRANDTDRDAAKALNDLIAQGEDIQQQGIRKRILLTKRLQTVKAEVFQVDNEMVNPVTGMTNSQLIKLMDEQEIIITGSAEELNRHVELKNKESAIRGEKAEIDLAQKKKAIAVENAQFSLQIAGDLAFALGSLAEEGSEAQKKFRVAGAIIDTLAGAVAGMLAGLSIGGPWGIALGIATSAAVLAAGYANVKKIQSTEPGGSISGGDSLSIPSVPQFNIVGDNQTTQLNEQLAAQNTQPVKAYVVGKDVTTSQEMDRNTVRTAGI